MRRALIISVGTGRNVESGIATSIKVHGPGFIIFVVTPQSEETVYKVQNILQGLPKHEKFKVTDENDYEAIYTFAREIFDKLAAKGFSSEDIVCDFTSGTKAMSVGLAFGAFAKGCQILSYVTGKRDENGRVISGTERVLPIFFSEIMYDSKIAEIQRFFNLYEFEAALNIIETLKSNSIIKTLESKEDKLTEIKNLEKVISAYNHWDKFDHKKAYQILRQASPKLRLKWLGGKSDSQLKFLGQLAENNKADSEKAVDLSCNAERCAAKGRFDDGVARLYRLIEFLAEIELRQKYGIDTSNVDLSKLKPEHKEKYQNLRDEETGRIKLGLFKAYELLADLNNDLGRAFLENSKLKSLLGSRNVSILAHGFKPVGEKVFVQLKEEVEKLLLLRINNLDELRRSATFCKLKII
ncbi:MAG: TIGR02710 family CRISPR-associated CARF protein [Actinomycetota bacterium]|nr:TIGR02710 family CRISPR-associated CARF protein [Actinomycetota bacterium]